MTTFSDIFKKSFLGGVEILTLEGFVVSMLAAFVCGMIIFAVYRKYYSGVVYNNNFNILLVMTSLVTCFIVSVISSNVVLSLGMVGALSIVRYRTAVKDPLDLGFLFWTIAVGVTCGAGLYMISLTGTVFIAVIFVRLVKSKSKRHQYLFVIKYLDKAAGEVEKEMKSRKKRLKNKTVVKDYTELTYEMHFDEEDEEDTSFVNVLSGIDGVKSAVLIEFSGDYIV